MSDWTQEQSAALYTTLAEALPSRSMIHNQLCLRFPTEAEGISPTDVAVRVMRIEYPSDPAELYVLAGVSKVWSRKQEAALDTILAEVRPSTFYLHQQLRDKFPEVSAPISTRDLEVKINEIEEARYRNPPEALIFIDAAKVVLLGLD